MEGGVVKIDGIPDDEVLLAIAIQEASARNLGPTMGEFFMDATADAVSPDDPGLMYCCAVGALVLAGVAALTTFDDDTPDGGTVLPRPFDGGAIAYGNDDCNSDYQTTKGDSGETLGHAFQLAMNGYGPLWYVDKTDQQKKGTRR